MMNIFKVFILVILPAFVLSGCAGVLPMPGSSESINRDFYENDVSMKERVLSLREGMTVSEAFAHLGRKESDFIMLDRTQIVAVLYGGQQLEFVQNVSYPMQERNFLRGLSGYNLAFKKVKRKHGLSSPISLKTKKMGYSYETNLIFKDGYLFEKPILSGGAVDVISKKTVFDYMTPATVMRPLGI